MFKFNVKYVVATIVAVVALVIISFIPMIGEDVKNNQIVINQFPWTGKMAFWTEPGFKWQWFGETTKYFKTNQVWFNEIDEMLKAAF